MGMFSCIKGAGEKLFGTDKAEAAQPAVPNPEQVAVLSNIAGEAIATCIGNMGLKVNALKVRFDPARETVAVAGLVPAQATREKVVLCCVVLWQRGHREAGPRSDGSRHCRTRVAALHRDKG
jgi:hypothetical protein